MSFTYEKSKENGYWLVKVRGDLDSHYTESFKNEMLESLGEEPLDLIIDAKDLDYLDSMGIGILISIYNFQKEKDKEIRIINLKSHIEKLFQITDLKEIFKIGDLDG